MTAWTTNSRVVPPRRRSAGLGWTLGVVLAVSVLPSRAPAAEFKPLDLPDGQAGILISGLVAPGDENAFHELARKSGKAIVVTTGPGGAVRSALLIGSEIRARGWPTLVPGGARCASACALIWLAGQTRMLGNGAYIGFHAMSVLRNGHREETHDPDIYLRRWLTELGYSMDTTATIVNTQAASVRWLDVMELRANGIQAETYP